MSGECTCHISPPCAWCVEAPSEEAAEYAGGDREFGQWLDAVNALLEKALPFGAGIFEMPDVPWASAYEDGLVPQNALELLMLDWNESGHMSIEVMASVLQSLGSES